MARGGRAVAVPEGFEPSDEEFDALLSPESRVVSAVHWTPISVCAEAVRMLTPRPNMRVLDVGCGPGKLCISGALSTGNDYVGVDFRENLIEEATRLAQRLGADTARFITGDAFDIDWSSYDALYFYNPFGELEGGGLGGIDARVHPDPAEYRARLAATQERLAGLRPGTRVVTFHGFGAPMPPAYSMLASQSCHDGTLELWIQTERVFSR